MLTNPKTAIISILEIINYQNDKETFADKFIELCIKQSFLEMIGDLPKEKVALLTSRIKSVSSLEQFVKTLKEYIHPSLLTRKIEQVSAKLFDAYIEGIFQTLDEDTKAKLMSYLAKIENGQ